MVLVTLIFLMTLGCFTTSVLCLILIIRHYYSDAKISKETSIEEAIVISGCDSGIGLELATYFFRTTRYKIICCFLNLGESEGFKKLYELMVESEGRLILQKLDVTSEEDVLSLVKNIESLIANNTFSKVVALINNAGVLTYGEFDWLTWDHIQDQIDVNLIGTLRLTRSLVPYIIESKGRIINVSSVNDTTVFPGLSVYSATKSGLSTFSRGLGFELRKFGVKVVLVRLGDFARLTNIMSKHSSNRDDMWTEMNSEKRALYKDFFHEFNNHLLENYGMTSPKKFNDSSLFHDFRLALLSKDPPNSITCAPLGFRIFYSIIELTPIWLQYQLLDMMFKIGFQWNPPELKSE